MNQIMCKFAELFMQTLPCLVFMYSFQTKRYMYEASVSIGNKLCFFQGKIKGKCKLGFV